MLFPLRNLFLPGELIVVRYTLSAELNLAGEMPTGC